MDSKLDLIMKVEISISLAIHLSIYISIYVLTLCFHIYIYIFIGLFSTHDTGLARHAMKVYERATGAVPKAERNAVWKLYIQRVSATFGVTYTRDLYSKAIESLPDKDARTTCMVLVYLMNRQNFNGYARIFMYVYI